MGSMPAWAGMLTPGAHLVQMYGPGGQPYEAQILVVAGKPLNVRSGVGGNGVPGIGILPVTPPKKDDPPALPVRRGLYILGLGSILFPLTHPPSFDSPQSNFGAGYGARVGSRSTTPPASRPRTSTAASPSTSGATRSATATRRPGARCARSRAARAASTPSR